MRIDLLTLFPEMPEASFRDSIIGRGRAAGLLDIHYYQIRDYTENRQRKVDDYPYGGGPGMIMAYQPIKAAYDRAVLDAGEKPHVVYMSPQGSVLDQKTALRLSRMPYLLILCGHYEGVDERVIEEIVDEEISIGDYVLTGGEIPAMVLTDCVARLVPGVLSSEESCERESHSALLLEYPQYTRPAEIDGRRVPEVLLSGDHAGIEKWRQAEAEKRTEKKRPDLYEKYRESLYNQNREIYLDNSATTRQLPAVTEEMNRIARTVYGNPSSLHSLGLKAEQELKKARKTVASCIGALPEEILFTSGGTEANNTAIKGYFAANKRAGKHIILSATEHPSVTEAARSLEEAGYRVSLAPVNASGLVEPDALEAMLTPDTAMVSVMLVNSETGAIQNIKEIAARVKRKGFGTVLHTDAVQAFGKLRIQVKELGADLLSASGHKIHGPRGVGFLYIRKGVRIAPLLHGGGQEGGLRSGTENLAAICGLSVAAKEACGQTERSLEQVSRLRQLLLDTLAARLGEKVTVLTDPSVSLPYIVNLSFAPLRAEVVLHSLESLHVFVSVGSACSSHKKNRSEVLTAMGIPPRVIDGAVRISFSRFTAEEDVLLACEAICKTVKTLKAERYRDGTFRRKERKNETGHSVQDR